MPFGDSIRFGDLTTVPCSRSACSILGVDEDGDTMVDYDVSGVVDERLIEQDSSHGGVLVGFESLAGFFFAPQILVPLYLPSRFALSGTF